VGPAGDLSKTAPKLHPANLINPALHLHDDWRHLKGFEFRAKSLDLLVHDLFSRGSRLILSPRFASTTASKSSMS